MALAAPEATVVRDGERQRLATEEIVPGDIVMVEAGDKIPADARLVELANLQTDDVRSAPKFLRNQRSSFARDPVRVGMTGFAAVADIVKRLMERGSGRSEATIQSDVRHLLLVAPFQLEEKHLDAPLEVPAGSLTTGL